VPGAALAVGLICHEIEWMIMRRILRVPVFGLVGTLCLFVLLVLDELVRILPWTIRAHWVEELAIFCLMVYAIARRIAVTGPEGSRSTRRATTGLNWLDSFTDWALRGGLALALGVFCLGLLLAWVPHYLVWPWHRDSEAWAVIAQSWDQGILPYRDIRAFNFPGAVYLAWVLGKVFGWGHTVPLYAFDSACLVLLGVVLVAWSRRRLGGAIPGLIGYLVFLTCYLNLLYEHVAQRDWHTALLVCLGLLVMQAWPGRSSRLSAAISVALALAIRPHAVLFLPALLWEVAHSVDGSESSRTRKIRAVLVWLVWVGVFVALAFSPLLLAGVADDLVRGLRVVAYGGPHNTATLADAIRSFADQFVSWRTSVPLVATLLLAARRQNGPSGVAKTWSWVWLGVLLYKPIHPMHHFYLLLPLFLVSSIAWAFVAYWLTSLQRSARPVFVLAVALLVYEIMPVLPAMCNFNESLRAVRPLLRGELPGEPPVACSRAFTRDRNHPSRWDEYREVLTFIRRETSPRTLVANVMNQFPYETINGPTGRLSPFLTESGICWMMMVDSDLDPEFARSLIDSTDSVVVWDPRQIDVDERLHIEQVIAVIRRYYEPAARFGRYEVWRRRSEERE
jgi:hypothetical protein